MNRRSFLSTASAGVVATLVTPTLATRAMAQSVRRTMVLVHGAWHGAWCWTPVATQLASQGFNVVAVDLPGSGLGARFPDGYLNMPQDADVLAAAPSPLASITLLDYQSHITDLLRGLVDNGSGPVVLVGHSLGGATLNVVGEAMPELVSRLVYLTAFNPVSQTSTAAYFADPSMASSKALPLTLGDPTVTGAVRINHLTDDPALRAASKAAFYADVSDEQFAVVSHLLTPDAPAAVLDADARVTADRWGKIPRTYIRCLEDQVIPIAAQDLFIAEADALVPGNPYAVRDLPSSHSPFISMPNGLAALLAEAAE